MFKILCSILLLWLLLIALAYVFQRRLIYVPQSLPASATNPAQWGMPELKAVQVKTSDGLSLLAWYRKPDPSQPTLVYFHGNAGNLASWGGALKPYIDAGYGAIMVDYRGYGVNPGKPTETGLYADGRGVIDFLETQGIAPNDMVLLGRSLGTGVAVQLATEYEVLALILQSPYTSLVDVGRIHYPYLPVKWLQKDQYRSLEKISHVHAPVLMLYGDADRVVPPHLTQKLYQAANQPKALTPFQGVGHNDFPPIFSYINDFLKQHGNKGHQDG